MWSGHRVGYCCTGPTSEPTHLVIIVRSGFIDELERVIAQNYVEPGLLFILFAVGQGARKPRVGGGWEVKRGGWRVYRGG